MRIAAREVEPELQSIGHAAVYITGGFNGTPPTGNIVGGTGPGEGNILSAGNSGVRIDGPFTEYGPRPALQLASRKDPYAARSVRELATGGGAGLRETQWAEIPAHGTILLARQPDVARSLVEWFQRTLAVN